MSFQSTVNVQPALGVPGSLSFDGPMRAAPWNLNSSSPSTPINTVGYAYTVVNGANPDPVNAASNAGTAMVGGTGVFAGILVNPKEYANIGASGAPLNANYNLPDNYIGQLLIMGQICVSLGNAASVGDKVYYNTTTGALGSTSPNVTVGVTASSTTLSVLSISGGSVGTGSQITLANNEVIEITAIGTGTGGVGTYTINPGVTLAATTAGTSPNFAPVGNIFIDKCVVDRVDVAASGLAFIRITQ